MSPEVGGALDRHASLALPAMLRLCVAGLAVRVARRQQRQTCRAACGPTLSGPLLALAPVFWLLADASPRCTARESHLRYLLHFQAAAGTFCCLKCARFLVVAEPCRCLEAHDAAEPWRCLGAHGAAELSRHSRYLTFHSSAYARCCKLLESWPDDGCIHTLAIF